MSITTRRLFTNNSTEKLTEQHLEVHHMKNIGVVAITTVGANICTNEIIAEAARRDPSGKHPEFTLHAFSFDRYKELVIKQDWNTLATLILESIEKLRKIGMDFIIIPSNTPHYGFDKIKSESPLPVINLIEITANECKKHGYKRVAVLGTKSTMLGGLFDTYLKSIDIIPVIPDAKSCEIINNLIMDEIIPFKDTRHAVAMQVAESILKKMDCDAYILGCTELPDVYTKQNLGKPVIDTTRLLSHYALDYSLSPELDLSVGNTKSNTMKI
jgi:aspartate racemase